MEAWIPDPVERAIRRAQDEGAFDDLPGRGRPIPDLDRPYDPAWWARRWVERERAEEDARRVAARVRREVPKAVGLGDRESARRRLEALNEEIDRVNHEPASGLTIDPLDIERLLSGFRN